MARLNVPGGQPGALLALPKAGNFCSAYPDTLKNGSTPGNLHTYDTHVDPEGRLPTHTFQSNGKP